MTPLGSVSAVMSATLLTIGPASAIMLTNRDTKKHTLTIDHSVQKDQQKAAAGADAQVRCLDRCEVRGEGRGYGWTASGEDKLVIAKGGLIRHGS